MKNHSSYKPYQKDNFWTSPRNGTIGGLIVLLLLSVGTYAGFSPYLTLWGISDAAQAKDGKKFASYIDFPVFKENLKAELTAQMTNDASLKDNPFAGLGTLLVSGIVDNLVTPAGIEKLMSGELFPTDPKSKPTIQTNKPIFANGTIDWNYESLNEFRVSVQGADGTPFTFIFERHWIGDWKLSGLKMPKRITAPVSTPALADTPIQEPVTTMPVHAPELRENRVYGDATDPGLNNRSEFADRFSANCLVTTYLGPIKVCSDQSRLLTIPAVSRERFVTLTEAQQQALKFRSKKPRLQAYIECSDLFDETGLTYVLDEREPYGLLGNERSLAMSDCQLEARIDTMLPPELRTLRQ